MLSVLYFPRTHFVSSFGADFRHHHHFGTVQNDNDSIENVEHQPRMPVFQGFRVFDVQKTRYYYNHKVLQSREQQRNRIHFV
jgi:hypothetical protein